MSITVQLSADLEKRLRQEAKLAGVNIERIINRLLEERFPSSSSNDVSQQEADLLLKINSGFSEDFWKEYFLLIDKRENYTILEKELKRLTKYSIKVELASAERLKYLMELANLRKMDLVSLMKELQITPRTHA